MKTEFTLPDFTYLPIVASGMNVRPLHGKPRVPLWLVPENYISDCTKDRAIGWIEEYEDTLTAIYCYEGGKLFDASSEIAKAWLKENGEALFESVGADSYKFPAFIRNHIGKELDEQIAQWEAEVAEGKEYISEIQFQYDSSRL